MAERKQAMQKPPPGIVFIEDYESEDGTEVIPGIASRLAVTPSTYRKWLMAGKGPDTFKLGKRRAARIAAIDAWIAEEERSALEPLAEEGPPEPKVTTAHGRPRRTPTAAPAVR